MKRCFQCMKQYEDIYNICPYCGYDENSAPKVEYHLRPGVVVNERYVIGVTLGYGGFGITYKAWDRKLATTVAIKYMKAGLYIGILHLIILKSLRMAE